MDGIVALACYRQRKGMSSGYLPLQVVESDQMSQLTYQTGDRAKRGQIVVRWTSVSTDSNILHPSCWGR